MRYRKTYFLILAFSAFVFLILSSGYFFFFTTKGSTFIIKSLISRYAKSSNIGIKEINGTLSQVMSFQDIAIENLKGLPEGSVLEIKGLEASLRSLNLGGLNVNVHNARLRIPGEDPVLFHGTCKDAYLDFNVYSKSIDIQTIIGLFEGNRALGNISGIIKNLDLYMKGPLLEPELTGGFEIEKLSRDFFSIENCPGTLDLKLKDIMGEAKIYGEVALEGGSIYGPKTAVIKFQQSKILFNGSPAMPEFDLKGEAAVDGVRINIALKGTKENPDLKLSSDPSLPEERLLLRLATNRSWQGTEVALSQGQMSPEVAADFIDYFVFAGSGSRIAQQFGISAVSLKYDKETKGFGIKKDISEKAGVSYAIEQPQTKNGSQTTTQKIESEYKITESVAVSAERELKQDVKTEEAQDKTQADDKVLLKYKKKF